MRMNDRAPSGFFPWDKTLNAYCSEDRELMSSMEATVEDKSIVQELNGCW